MGVGETRGVWERKEREGEGREEDRGVEWRDRRGGEVMSEEREEELHGESREGKGEEGKKWLRYGKWGAGREGKRRDDVMEGDKLRSCIFPLTRIIKTQASLSLGL